MQRNLLEHATYSHFSLTRGNVSEHNLAGDIAAGKHVRQVRLHEVIHHDSTAVKFDVRECLQSLEISAATDGNENLVRLISLSACCDFVAVDGFYFGRSENVDAGFAVLVEQNLHNLLIQVRQDGRHGFDNRDRNA